MATQNLGDSTPRRGRISSKGPEVRTCLEFQNCKEAREAGVEQESIAGVEVIKATGWEQRDRTS